jgi:hypothetical protein
MKQKKLSEHIIDEHDFLLLDLEADIIEYC